MLTSFLGSLVGMPYLENYNDIRGPLSNDVGVCSRPMHRTERVDNNKLHHLAEESFQDGEGTCWKCK